MMSLDVLSMVVRTLGDAREDAGVRGEELAKRLD